MPEKISSWVECASRLPRESTSDCDKLMAALYYRLRREQVESTEVEVIRKEFFNRAGWPRPPNLAATARYCRKRGWLVEVQNQKHKAWKLTEGAINHVERRFREFAQEASNGTK